VKSQPQSRHRTPATRQFGLPVVATQLGLLLLMVYLIVNDGRTGLGGYDFSRRAIVQWVGIALIAIWLIWRLRRPDDLVSTPFTLPLLGLLFAVLVAALFSVNPFISLEAVILYIIYFLFFLMAVDLTRWPWLIELILNGIIGATVIVVLRSLLLMTLFLEISADFPFLSRLAGWGTAMADPNRLAMYLTPVVCLTIYKSAISSKRAARLVWILLVILLLAALALTQSRGGLVGVAAAVTYFGLVLFRRKNLKISFGPGPKIIVAVVIASLLLVGLFVITSRDVTWQSDAVQTRVETIEGAIKTLVAHPITGSGPATLGEEMLRLQPELEYGIHAHAHNLYLTFVAENGLLGLVALAVLVVVTVKELFWTRAEPANNREDLLKTALTAALIGFATHNLLDSFLEFPVGLLLMATLFGFRVGLAEHGGVLAPGRAKWVTLMAVVGLVAVTIVGVFLTLGTRAYYRAVSASHRGDWPAVVNNMQRAVDLSPQSWIYPRQLALAYGYLSRDDPANLDPAIAHYRLAMKDMDRLAPDQANLGCLLWKNGARDQAIESIRQAGRLKPENRLYQLNLAYYLEAAGLDDEARDEYARLIAEEPEFLRTSYWQQTRWREENLPAIIEQVAEQWVEKAGSPSLGLAHLYAEADYFSEAALLYDQLVPVNDSPAVHLGRAELLIEMAEYDRAGVELEKVLARNPNLAKALLFRARIHLAQDELDQAFVDIEKSLALETSATVHYQRGQIAELQGDTELALEQYESAIALARPSMEAYSYYDNAIEVLTRRVAPAEEHLPCLMRPYVTDEFVLPTLALGTILEQKFRWTEAVKFYQQVLAYEPNEAQVKARLNQLCQEQPDSCFDMIDGQIGKLPNLSP